MLGEWLNIVAPVRAGDALKVALIRRESGKTLGGVPSAIGAVLADKVVDGMSLVMLCAAAGSISLLWARSPGAHLHGLGGSRRRACRGCSHATAQRLAREALDLDARSRGRVLGLRDGPRVLAGLAFGLASWVAEGGGTLAAMRGIGCRADPFGDRSCSSIPF